MVKNEFFGQEEDVLYDKVFFKTMLFFKIKNRFCNNLFRDKIKAGNLRMEENYASSIVSSVSPKDF